MTNQVLLVSLSLYEFATRNTIPKLTSCSFLYCSHLASSLTALRQRAVKQVMKQGFTKRIELPTGEVRYEKITTDYLPVAARIPWSRKERPYWSIVIEVEKWGDKAVVMKATVKDMLGTVIATARKKETEIGFPDYIEKAETGAIGRALAMCGYGTLQAPEFDEQQDRLADSPIEKAKTVN